MIDKLTHKATFCSSHFFIAKAAPILYRKMIYSIVVAESRTNYTI
jgi:hypothetical protein